MVILIGATIQLEVVWSFSGLMNGLMALPNLIGLIILAGLVARETRHYLRNDPKLMANKEQIETFMVGEPGGTDWKAGNQRGSSWQRSSSRAPSKTP